MSFCECKRVGALEGAYGHFRGTQVNNPRYCELNLENPMFAWDSSISCFL